MALGNGAFVGSVGDGAALGLLLHGDELLLHAGGMGELRHVVLREEPLEGAEALRITSYNVCYAKLLRWSRHLGTEGTLAVDFTTASSVITHSRFGALKVKDAVVDQFRERTGA